ncbi:MAG: class I SAM-dependent methyltransferase [Burkholderiaceae bacterium]
MPPQGGPALDPGPGHRADPPPAEPGGPPPADWRTWLESAPGRYVIGWEQDQLDQLVADIFGFVALQCGMRELQGLAQNRMRSRVLVSRSNDAAHYRETQRRPDVVIDTYEDLPFQSESVDLVVLPHVLEFADDPHQVLREMDRILRPEGRILITGFNPVSLWGAGQMGARLLGRHLLPQQGHFISLPRLRDWFKLLSFEFERGSYGCYRPPFRTDRWLERTAFLESAGDRWWPICGGVYTITAVKRVRGMRIIGPAWKQRPRSRRAMVVPTSGYGAERTPLAGSPADTDPD